jgi:hypothetical protein
MSRHKKTECSYHGCTATAETRKITKRGEDSAKYLCRKHKSQASSGQDQRSTNKSSKEEKQDRGISTQRSDLRKPPSPLYEQDESLLELNSITDQGENSQKQHEVNQETTIDRKSEVSGKKKNMKKIPFTV